MQTYFIEKSIRFNPICPSSLQLNSIQFYIMDVSLQINDKLFTSPHKLRNILDKSFYTLHMHGIHDKAIQNRR
ncbi:hypothetical protein DF039_37230 [Burkholderia cenocepacia]|nr:hypothetical protein DF039_37230 [Burkholderia cenocepacia]